MSQTILKESETHRFIIDERHNNMRLDKALADLIEDFSRSRVQALIDQQQVMIGSQICESASKKVSEGDVVEVNVPPVRSAEPEAEDIALDVVYEDEDLLVINKQAGLVVHPGAGNWTGTLVNALLHYCGDDLSGIGGVARPGIVHRLDKDTSGLMVVAKNDVAHKGLSSQLEDRSLSRKYKALVLGVPMPPKGYVDQPLGRHSQNRLKMSVDKTNGKQAKTHYHVINSYGDQFALVECVLESGRTHQIRVHMGYIKYPIIGDPLYGPQATAVKAALKRGQFSAEVGECVLGLDRQFLHAYALSFIHPVTEERLSFEQDVPSDMSKVLNSFI